VGRGGSKISGERRGQGGRGIGRTGVTEGTFTASSIHPSSQVSMPLRLAGNGYQFTVVVGRPRSPGRMVQARHGSRSICGFFTGHRGQCTRSRKKTRRNARFSSGVICCRSPRHSEFRSLLIGYHPFSPVGHNKPTTPEGVHRPSGTQKLSITRSGEKHAAAEAYH
jgi:hypothetical protein